MKITYRLIYFLLFLTFITNTALPQIAKVDFKSYDTVLISGNYKLHATLKMPAKKLPVACVIFLNGSGPIDKEGTVGPNKIAADILTALANKGVASFVYDKRTLKYAKEIYEHYDSFTVIDEYVDDALAALIFVEAIKSIDQNKIFFIGHSQGGNMIPYICSKAKDKIRGIVLLAASSKKFEELIGNQLKYLLSLDSNNNLIKKQYQQVQRLIPNLLRVYEGIEVKADSLPFQLPDNYWRSMLATSITDYLPKVNCPILILQGSRDYQVTLDDNKGLVKLTTKKQQVNAVVLDSLNHLFIAGTGRSTPIEYSFPGHVSAAVVEQIINFISTTIRSN